MTHTDNPRRRQNVTRQMAIDSVRVHKASMAAPKRAFIWYDNARDGWHWDWEGSECLGERNGQPPTTKLIEVR